MAAVLAANLFLRRIARKIEQPHVTDGDTQIHYRFRVVCRSQDENYIRPLLLSSMVEPNLVLHALHTADVEPATGNVEIRADLICQGPQDALLERTVTRLSLEPGVSAVSWDITGQELEALTTAVGVMKLPGQIHQGYSPRILVAPATRLYDLRRFA